MSVEWLGRLSRGSLFDYALAMGPIAAGFLLVPTLSCAAAREPPEWWPQLSISLRALHAHWTHSADAEAQGRWWTCVACAVCHADAASRDHALPSLLLSGLGPATSFGAVATWLTFFGGSAVAALDASGRELQTQKWLEGTTGGWAAWATPRAARLYNATGMWRVCGASAGIFALSAVNLCLMLEHAHSMVRRWEEEPSARPYILASVAWAYSGLSNAYGMILDQERSPNGLTWKPFAWGIGCYFLFKILSSRSPWWRRQQSIGSRLRSLSAVERGGRVLGGREVGPQRRSLRRDGN
ncbi:MAG: hypothetical protein SGPRY_002371 [Prymnesium sp.]